MMLMVCGLYRVGVWCVGCGVWCGVWGVWVSVFVMGCLYREGQAGKPVHTHQRKPTIIIMG